MIMMKNQSSAIYIHIPFCKNICSYCDFCKFYYHKKTVVEYLKVLRKEIKSRYQQEIIHTIYIGGGTPSSLEADELCFLFDSLKNIRTSKTLEFTVECNVVDITEDKLKLLKRYGVNRLSIGVQSFQDNILRLLERNYEKKEIIEKIDLAKQYFSNINIDIIYAVPGEDLEMLQSDLELFLSLDVSHISTYSLMLEEHTKLKIKKMVPIAEELDQKMYEMIEKTLTKHHYIHYEISNYSKENYQSRHNLTYWQNQRYYGFGLGASGYIGDIRYTNTKNLKKYLNLEFIAEQEVMMKKIEMSNEMILGLRTIYGVDEILFQAKYGNLIEEVYEVEDLVKDKILIHEKNHYYIHPNYWYVANEILVKFV